MRDNGSQATDRTAKDKLSERAFWVAFRRALLALASVIERHKLKTPIDD